MADEDCGCKIIRQRAGRHDSMIVFCSLHSAAPDLLTALNNATKLAHKNTNGHNSWVSFRECAQATCLAASAAIRKAEGN